VGIVALLPLSIYTRGEAEVLRCGGAEVRRCGGLRNRVSFLDAKDNFDMPIRNPVSGVFGSSAGIKKPGFFVAPDR
jgi:hypothetical protein